MPNFETHVIMGHIGNEVEIRYTSEGVAVTSINVAVNNPFKKDDPPTWYKCSAWRQQAEFVAQYAKKGDAVLVQGDQLALEEWTAQDGTIRTSITLQARSVQLLGKRGETQPSETEDVPF